MKHLQKTLSLLLALVMLLSLVGCVQAPDTTASQNISATQPSTTQTTPTTRPTTVPTQPTTQPTDPTDPTEPTQPEPEKEPLVYTLTQEEVDNYYVLLDRCEDLALIGENVEEIEVLFEELDAMYNYLYAQNSIATVHYYADMKDEALTQRHLDCMDICADANDAYIQMVRRVYLSDTPAKDALFEGWSQQDIAYLLNYDERVVQLNKRNAEITVEYQAATDDAVKIALFKETVLNNNAIAQIYGYETYYEYASELIYKRDYGADELENMRRYGKEYLADLYSTALDTFRKNYNRLSSVKQQSVSAFRFNDYDSIRADHIGRYLQVMPDTMEEHIQNMIKQDSLFTKSNKAMAGAFTISVGDRSYCFFGPGYANLATVIHEGGHYYASQYADLNSIPMDLAETHSQANEWLFLAYLDGKFAANEYQSVMDYRFCSDLSTVLVCLMVDEFEQKVYATDVTNFTAADFDAIMDGIVSEYFDPEYAATNLADMNSYWRQVVVDHPVYYLSYAVSAVAAIDLYTVAQADFEAAKEIYRKLCEEPLDAGFLANIQAAGLAGPFDESFYKELQEILNNRK